MQKRQVALQKEQIQNKIDAIGVGTGTTVADKAAKLELKNTAALTDEKDKQLKLDMAKRGFKSSSRTRYCNRRGNQRFKTYTRYSTIKLNSVH